MMHMAVSRERWTELADRMTDRETDRERYRQTEKDKKRNVFITIQDM